MSKLLAITGITGKSGFSFAEVLAQNYSAVEKLFPGGIRVLVRSGSNTAKLDNILPKAEKIKGSLKDKDYIKKSFEGVDTIIHIAGIHLSEEIVNAAVINRVRRMILVHTTGVYSKYKAAGEEYRRIDDYVYETCRKNNITLTILRPTMIYGCAADNNIIKFIKMVDRLPFMPVINGARYELQPVHYKDLGTAYFNVLMNEELTVNKDFILSGGAPIFLRDILLEIGKNLNKRVRFINIPYSISYIGAWLVYLVTFKKLDYREKVQRLCESRAFSYDEAASAFGYQPMTFQDGIIDEIKEYKMLKIRKN